MPTLLIRADATPAMGTGHVMRTLAVAQEARIAGWRVGLAFAALPETLKARLEAAGLILLALPVPAAGPDDAAATIASAQTLQAAALLVDGYHFSADWRRRVREGGQPPARCRYRTAAFDDQVNGVPVLEADLVIHPAAHPRPPPAASRRPGLRYLSGPAFLPLRAEFRAVSANSLPPPAQRPELLLTLGGSDPAGLTLPCLQALSRRLPAATPLAVVIGAANPHAAAIAAWSASHAPAIQIYQDCPDMAGRMAAAGLALAAAGGTVAELAALAVPAVLAILADNQQPAATAAAAAGWCEVVDGRRSTATAGLAATTATTALAEILADRTAALWAAPEQRNRMAARIAGTVDAAGTARILSALTELSEA